MDICSLILYLLSITEILSLQLRKRGHDYTLPKVRTERFKRILINMCLFNIV